MHPGLSAKCNVVWKSQRNYSATSETKPVSSRITRAFQTTLTALTEPGTLSQLITHYLSLSIHTSIALCPECCAIYTPTEWHMCYTLCRGSTYAVAVYLTPSNVYGFLQPSAIFILYTIATYWMLHSPHICFALRCCHLLQYGLHCGSSTCCCICFAIIILYMSEMYCLIFTLFCKLPSVPQILRWSIVRLRCLIRNINI
jgi:hypothetical protein